MAKDRRDKGEGSFFQRKDGLWVGKVELPPGPDGKRKTKSVTSKDRNVALKKWNQLKRDVEDGYVRAGRSTVEAWMNHWLEEVARHKMRPHPYNNAKSLVRVHIVPHLGKKQLEDITPSMVRSMENKILATRSPSTVRHVHHTLSAALDVAVEDGMIKKNPAEHVDPPAAEYEERNHLTLDQAKAVLRTSFKAHDPYATKWALHLLTGVRQGEALGLTWDRVNFDTLTLDFQWALQKMPYRHGCGPQRDDETFRCGKKQAYRCPSRVPEIRKGFSHIVLEDNFAFVPPKTKKSRRVIPMPLPLAELLKEHYRTSPPNRHNLVWTAPDGRPLRKETDLQNWKAAVSRAGIHDEVVLHAARHTTASLLLEAGVDEAVIMSILGHTSVLTTRGYAHTSVQMAREALGKLDLLELE